MKWWRRVVLLVSLAGLALATRTTRLLAFEQHLSGKHYEDIYYLPSPTSLPVLSLGYQAALADLIWCRSLVYFGEELGQRGIVKYVFAYTDAILALDPSFRAAYRWVPTAAIYRPTEVSMESGLAGADYLRRALQRWPDDGELHWDYGSLLRFELAPLERDKAKKRALIDRATPHLEAAARLGAGPPWLALNNAQLLDKLGQTEHAIRQLEEMHSLVSDESVRRDIEWQLRRMKSNTYLEAMAVAQQDFDAAHQQSFPYLSPGLFFLVGARPAADAHMRFVAAAFTDDVPAAEDLPLPSE